MAEFAASELFDRLFKEGMALVEEAASYLDGAGRTDSRKLNRELALVYAAESMEVTTRLMQAASWLVVQRAVRERTRENLAALRDFNQTSVAAVIDAVCYGYSAATKATLIGAGYSCEGTPADNLPHKDAAGAGDVDVSIQRRPGGALGNCIDTGDSAADFITTMPAQPQSTLSPTTP